MKSEEQAYKIYEENGKTYFEGYALYPRKIREDYYLLGKTKFSKTEIVDKGEVADEKKSKCGSGYMHLGAIIKLKDGQHYLIHPGYDFIGRTSDDSIIIKDKDTGKIEIKSRWNKENIKKIPKQQEFFWKTEEEEAKEDTSYNPFDPRIFLAK